MRNTRFKYAIGTILLSAALVWQLYIGYKAIYGIQKFVKTPCVIKQVFLKPIQKRSAHHSVTRSHTTIMTWYIEYEYTFNNQKYSSHRYSITDEFLSAKEKGERTSFTQEIKYEDSVYKIDNIVDCFVNPAEPAYAVLSKETNKFYLLIFPGVLIVLIVMCVKSLITGQEND